MTAQALPTRTLPPHPHFRQLRRQARELLQQFRAGEAAAVAEVSAHFHAANPATFALHDSQLVLARAYGFESWPKLKAAINGVTIERLTDAVRARDIGRVRAMLRLRPELALKSADYISPLHHAVINADLQIVRLLTAHGANPLAGVYPYRETTGALTLARERGLTDIVAVMEQTAAPHRATAGATPAAPSATGDWGGPLTAAARDNRLDAVRQLLDQGADPNDRVRFRSVGGDAVVFNSGMPLVACASSGHYEIAELLLDRGADPNADVYATGTPVMAAYRHGDLRMAALLKRYGGRVDAATAGAYGLVDEARALLAGPHDDPPRGSVPEQLLLEAAGGGHADIVRLALEHVDWPRDDPRWFGALEQPVRRATGLDGYRLMLERCDPGVRGRGPFGLTPLHTVAGSRDSVPPDMRVAFATMLLHAGARLDVRDNLLGSTPLAWACRWQRPELVQLFLERGADPIEREAPEWAAPVAYAARSGNAELLALIRRPT